MINDILFDNYIMERLDVLIPGTSARREREREKFLHFIINLRQIIAGAVAMLDADNIPDGLDFRHLELFRYCNGHVGIMKHDKYGLVCFPGTFAGDLDAYGRGILYEGSLLSGESMSGERGKDVVVIPNNYLYTADFPLFYSFAKRLTEVDTSLDNNVYYTRLAPLIKVANNKIKDAVDQILADISIGGLKSIISDDLENDIEGLKSIDVFNITDVKDVDKIQYLSKYHDDLLRRLYILGGHSMSGSQKMAQQSAYEVGQNDTISMIYPLERLNTLREGVEHINQLFNTNMEVRFSEAWQVEKEKIETTIAVSNQAQDQTQPDASRQEELKEEVTEDET